MATVAGEKLHQKSQDVLQVKMADRFTEVLNGIVRCMAPYGLKKALLLRAVELFLRLEVEPALGQVASPRLEEKVVLPLWEVRVVWGGGAKDASLAPDKTAGALSLSDRNRITKTRRCSSGTRL